jgi:Transposase DDE domain
MNLLELYCHVDGFAKIFLPEWNKHLLDENKKKRNRLSRLSPSEIITILIHFHQSQYRNFKSFYLLHVCQHLRSEFPDLLSYNRFIALVPTVFAPLCAYLQSQKAHFYGIGFVDSTPIIVCHSKRIYGHKVFKGIAEIGKSTKGWFYGFKLHLICNHRGELVSCQITPGNVDDRSPIPEMAKDLFGKLFGDKGYISKKLFDALFLNGLQLVTGIKNNMKNKLMPLFDKLILRKRSMIESINNQLKNVFQIEHTRHRSPINGFINIIAGLIAFTHHDKKPQLDIDVCNIAQLIS